MGRGLGGKILRLTGRMLRATVRGIARVLRAPEQAAGRVGVWIIVASLVLTIVSLASIPVVFAAMLWWSGIEFVKDFAERQTSPDWLEVSTSWAEIVEANAGLLIIGVVAAVGAAALLGWAWKAWTHHPDATDTP